MYDGNPGENRFWFELARGSSYRLFEIGIIIIYEVPTSSHKCHGGPDHRKSCELNFYDERCLCFRWEELVVFLEQ